jgi:hypothetical protein
MVNYIRGMGNVLTLDGVHQEYYETLIGRSATNIADENWRRVGDTMLAAILKTLQLDRTRQTSIELENLFSELNPEESFLSSPAAAVSPLLKELEPYWKNILNDCMDAINEETEEDQTYEQDQFFDGLIIGCFLALALTLKGDDPDNGMESLDLIDSSQWKEILNEMVNETLEEKYTSSSDQVGGYTK